jgi:hypothetical protein
MKRFFKNDFQNIGFATRIAHYAEKIGKSTDGVNLAAILCSSYLLNIGYPTAAEKKPVVCRKDLENTGPPVAQEILLKLGAEEELISTVSDIIGNVKSVRSKAIELSQAVVWDAYHIAVFEQQIKKKNETIFNDYKDILTEIQTESGKKELHRLYKNL